MKKPIVALPHMAMNTTRELTGSCMSQSACRFNSADGRSRNLSRAGRGPPRAESGAASIAAASVRVGEVDPGRDFTDCVSDEAHGPLAMAALVRRRRLQRRQRGFERGQGPLHVALIGFRR